MLLFPSLRVFPVPALRDCHLNDFCLAQMTLSRCVRTNQRTSQEQLDIE